MFPSNWKLASENFLGDSYHNPSHRSVDLIGIGPSARTGAKGRRDNELELAKHVWISFAAGHGVHSAVQAAGAEYIAQFANDPEIEEYFRHCHNERNARLGDNARLLPFTGTIFPNTSYHGRQPRNLCVWHPHGTTETEGWRFFLVDADAPAKVKDFLRRFYMRYSGPAGMTEQDDMENWLYATRASVGTIARRYPFNYQLARNQAELHPEVNGLTVRGRVTTKMTEHMARGYYRRWRSYLDGADWDELLGQNDPRFSNAKEAEE